MDLIKHAQFNGVQLDCYVEPEQIGRLLEYSEPLSTHEEGTQKVIIICRYSNQPKANDVMNWLAA